MTKQQPTVLLDAASPDETVAIVATLPDSCTCGRSLLPGYGLAGGGMGPYALCDGDLCGKLFKILENDDD